MATTFSVFSLGTATSIDPTEGDAFSNNASALVGATFGAAGDPLVNHIQTFSPGSTGYSAGSPTAYDIDNNFANDTFSINGGPNQTMDGAGEYSATITYVDGTTATISAIVFQDTNGNLYLAPELDYNADQIALEAQGIRSITLDSLLDNNFVVQAERYSASFATCFASGTTIQTPRGEVPIDDLRVGDLVTTLDHGAQPIRWIGRREIGLSELRAHPQLCPVRIGAGTLGARRDLLVSQQHGLLLPDGHLMRAKHLAARPGSGVRIAKGCRQVSYIHLMFDAHQIIFAEGVAAESFYPGVMAQIMLTGPNIAELRRVFPKVFSYWLSPQRISTNYGAPVRPFLRKRDLEALTNERGPPLAARPVIYHDL
ncbi:Hint domain-containing protein [Thioclava sp. A2]|uniref:Hint domain-containing protein n=1 Tax=Thioclava sp. FCG-A2 TaxID=3080562 RepID=UPI002954A66E|nr:Hint domain-containing protein [Thioclava sp. A2]MDV7269953.1 Hint domain-containing protein [Thioclava sp. A2]